MQNNLYYHTVTPALQNILQILMKADEFKDFRLVGGTALSLHRGHRLSVDIDLFTDVPYGSIDFEMLNSFLKANFNYIDAGNDDLISFGSSYFVGECPENSVKLDIYYSNDPFLFPEVIIDGIRLATVEEIIAMKLDVVNRGGRKKDYWDIHELMDDYSIEEMFDLHKKRHPYVHNREELRKVFVKFENADMDFEPNCFRGKYWEIIKLDLIQYIRTLK